MKPINGARAVLSLLVALLLQGAVFAAGEDGLVTAAPESVGISSERLKRIHAFVQDLIDRDEIAGAVTLVARRGRIVHLEAHGLRYREEKLPMQPDTIFHLMSMTKPIAATALMMLWEEGRFRLDDPIAKWIPTIATKHVQVDAASGRLEPPVRPVTFRHVLTHTSGLPQLGGPFGFGNVPHGDQAPKTLWEALQRAEKAPLVSQPGEKFQYPNSLDYVALLVEKISGLTMDQFLRRRIFEPLGMRDTFYNIPPEKFSRVAAVYAPAGKGIELFWKPQPQEPTTYFPGRVGLSGTATDYFRFAQMLLNGGELNGRRLLGRMTVDLMLTNQIGDLPITVLGPGYGFGLGGAVLTNPAKSADALSIGSYSWGGAYGTLFWIDPAEELTGVLMAQIYPPARSNIRPLWSVVVSQAVIDHRSDQKPKVMGRKTPR